MIIGKSRTNQPVEGDDSALAKSLENQDVEVKTISQSQPNWEVDIKSLLTPVTFKDTTDLYAKMVLLSNELSLVISGKFVAQTEANTYKYLLNNANITIPDDIASKIFRADGTSLKEYPINGTGFNTYIVGVMGLKGTPTIGNGTVLLTSAAPKQLTLTFYGYGATTEDDVCWVDVRMQLVII